MKKMLLVSLLLFAMSSMAMASPLTDYAKGNATLDINYRNNSSYDASVGVSGLSERIEGEFDGENNWEWGFTYGIGNNWALQYRQATPKGTFNLIDYEGSPERTPEVYTRSSSDITAAKIDLEAKTRVEEYNVLYKLDKNFSLFTGLVKASPQLKVNAGLQMYWEENYSGDIAIVGHDKNIWQFGLMASAPIADKLTAYGIAAFGSDYRNWEAGLGYEIGKNLELNVNYRNIKIEDMTAIGISAPEGNYDVTSDTKAKGWGFGVTYKF